MHPLLADVRRLAAYLAAWLLAALGLAALLADQGRAEPTGACWFALPSLLAYGCVCLSAYYVCRALPLTGRQVTGMAALYLGAALSCATAATALAWGWNAMGRVVSGGTAWVVLGPVDWALVFGGAGALYLVSLLAHDLQFAAEATRQAVRREAESRVLARDAELQMLRAQINPHFLFNSLNSISALIAIDPAQAREMTIDLAQFFRRTLALAGRPRIPLAEELALCEHYAAIERRRFGDRLHMQLDVDAAAPSCLVPPMSLQPLLENAFKHGIRQLDEGGTVTVRAAVHEGWLRVRVDNPVADGRASPADPQGGVGLANIRQRLSVLHGSRADLAARRTPGHFEIVLTLPAETESTP